jgi:enoyl-CoA hydratase/carnithine racemase
MQTDPCMEAGIGGDTMSTISLTLVRLEHHQHVLRLRLCRPDRYNAIDSTMLRTIASLLDDHHHAPLPLIIEGDGEVFSVGADISELAAGDAHHATTYSLLGHRVMHALEQWPGVTIAALSGYTLGVGLELALGCDILVGRRNLRLGLPGLAWAMVPCIGGLRRLACRSGDAFSSDLFLNGEVLDSDLAMRHGLIDRVIDDPESLEQLAYDVGEFSPAAVHAIRSLRLSRQGPIDAILSARMFSQPFANGECQRRLKQLLAD